MQPTFPKMFVYRIDVPWCNTSCLPQLAIFFPSIPQKEQKECRRELRDSISKVGGIMGGSSGRKTVNATPGLRIVKRSHVVKRWDNWRRRRNWPEMEEPS